MTQTPLVQHDRFSLVVVTRAHWHISLEWGARRNYEDIRRFIHCPLDIALSMFLLEISIVSQISAKSVAPFLFFIVLMLIFVSFGLSLHVLGL